MVANQIQGKHAWSEEFTVVLACNAAGDMLKPMVIFKREALPKLDQGQQWPRDVVVHVQTKGWLDEAGMRIWAERVLARRPGHVLGRLQARPHLLIMDSMPAHATESIKEHLRENDRAHLAIIPGGCTSALQPLRVNIDRSFMAKFKALWSEWLMHQGHNAAKPPSPTPYHLTVWVSKAVSQIPRDFISNAFRCLEEDAKDLVADTN